MLSGPLTGLALLTIGFMPIWLHFAPVRFLRQMWVRRAVWSALVIAMSLALTWRHWTSFVDWHSAGEISGEIHSGALNPYGGYFLLVLLPQAAMAAMGILIGLPRILLAAEGDG